MARASEGSPPPRDPTRSDVVDAVLRSKGVNNIMDLDAEEEKPPHNRRWQLEVDDVEVGVEVWLCA
jgi:hypothetical protein